MTMGRPNKGLGHVDGLDGTDAEKERLRAILATISGELSVQDACAQLGIGPARFGELRQLALQGACDSLAPGRPGRPPRRDAERDRQLSQLEEEKSQLRRELRMAWAKSDLALAMPEIIAEYQKKGATPRRRNWKGKPS
jgi:hypothetical protein